MKKETYLRLTKIVRGHPRRIRLIAVCNRLLAGIFYVLYPLFLLLLLLRRHPFLLRAALFPQFLCGSVRFPQLFKRTAPL